jgi:hypothetical protein
MQVHYRNNKSTPYISVQRITTKAPDIVDFTSYQCLIYNNVDGSSNKNLFFVQPYVRLRRQRILLNVNIVTFRYFTFYSFVADLSKVLGQLSSVQGILLKIT